MYLSEWQDDETEYDRILKDNELGMFQNCEHDFEWYENSLVMALFTDLYNIFPPLFINCQNCAGLYPLPRYMEML